MTINTMFNITAISRVSLVLMPLAYILSRLASELALGGSAIYAFRKGGLKGVPHSFVAIGVLWVYILLNTLWSVPENWFDAIIWARYPLFSIAVSRLLSCPKTNRSFYYSLIATVVFLVLDGYWQYFSGHDVLGMAIHDAGKGSMERLTGPFKYPRLGSALFAFGLPAWAWMYENYWQRLPLRKQIIRASAVAMAIVFLVFLSGERRAMAGILAGFGLAVWFTAIPRHWLLSIGAALLVTLAAVGYWFVPEMLERQAYTFIEALRDFPNSSYGKVWVTALNLAEQNLLLGVGLKQLRMNSTVEDGNALHAHNYYLEMLSEVGIIGLALFITWVVLCLKETYSSCINTKFSILNTTTAITLLLHLLPITPNPSFYTNWGAMPVWLLIGMLTSQKTNSSGYVHIH